MATMTAEAAAGVTGSHNGMTPENLRERRKWKHLFRYEQDPSRRIDPDSHEETDELRKAPVTRVSLLRFWSFVRPHRFLVFTLCGLTLLNQGMMVVMPVAIGHIFDAALWTHDAALLNLIVLGLLTFVVVRAGLLYINRILMMQAGMLIVRDVRRKMHAHMQRLSLRFLEDYKVGRIVSRIVADSEAIRNLLGGGVIQSVSNSFRLIFVAGTLFWVNWRLALVSCFTMPFFIAGVMRFLRRLKPAQKELSEDRSRLWARANETFSGVRVVKTYGSEQREDVGFMSRVHMMLRKALLLRQTHATMVIFWELSYWIGLVAMIWYGGHLVLTGNMRPGELVAFYGLLGLLYGPIAELINVSETVQAAMASIERIGEVLDTKSEIVEKDEAREAGELKGAVIFDNVTFKYKEPKKRRTEADGEEGAEPEESQEKEREHTLEEISFNVPAGKCVALVGPSGAGKSTLTNLLARFYDVDAGNVKVDGIDIRDYKLDSFRRNLAIVLQDTFLFCGSIRENIAYSYPNATDEQVIRAAKMAGAWEFIQESQDGLDTRCGERGVRLSGGQKQRISIARAILADPRILILDEATSALDSQTEAQIQGALDTLMKGRTTFVIAHRLSTIVNADIIVVMDQGRIVETGTHEELLDMRGMYYDMFQEQYGRVRLGVRTAAAPARCAS